MNLNTIYQLLQEVYIYLIIILYYIVIYNLKYLNTSDNLITHNPNSEIVENKIILLEDESVYTGTTLNGLRHGKGKLEMPNFKFEGEFFYNKIHGKGKLEENGLVYFGKYIVCYIVKEILLKVKKKEK